ncbi:MAG: hypothetical protein RLP44_12700 [Aggregatilineales bacterium]
MKRALILLLLILSGCQYYNLLEMSQHEIDPELQQLFTDAFYSPECDNPCWLGIEVGVTRGDEVIPILESHGIAYGVPGVIHLHSIPAGTVPGIVLEGSPSADGFPVFGDINVNPYSEDVVPSMDFVLDLCVQTVIDAYGIPEVLFTESGIPSTLIYLNDSTLFSVDTETMRIDWMILHDRPYWLSLPNDFESWSLYAHLFPDDCTDALTETAEG